jgi:hypothetical protein
MYRRIGVLLLFGLVIAVASPGNATMSFTVDVDQDGTEDISWPLAVGDTVTVDILVSNIPAPGLGAMGFLLTYNATALAVTAANVDTVNWPSAGSPTADYSTPGEVLFLGNRIPEVTGLSSDGTRLATVTFQRIGAGAVTLELLDYDPGDWFTTVDDPPLPLDGDIGTGITLATIQPPIAGDVSGDGNVDLADAVLTLQILSATGTSTGFATGDVSGDNAIGIEEGIWILQDVAGLR